MKLSEQWLREWVPVSLDTMALAEQLTMAGLEVDSIEPVAAMPAKVVVGKVLEVEQHPDADRLRICKVDVGRTRPLTIVCGAGNAAPNIKVPTALVGAELPNGLKIKPTEIRGQKSSGMLCAAAELGLEESSEGLLILDSRAPVGTEIAEYLGLDDNSIEVDLTPNRSDCLSVAGIAREVSALTGTRLKAPKIAPIRATGKARLPVRIQAKSDCPRYVGRVIEGIDANASTPFWLKEKLRRSGIRAIHPVVDVTNYVMLELGQPMHGFDLGKVDGAIVVRLAKDGETLTLLDGTEITPGKGTLLIADKTRPLALAGIMGGSESGVSDSTTEIFLESAFFRPGAIAGKARSLGLHTDSSHRFERGVDPMLQRQAIERATALLLAIVGGKAGPVVEDIAKDKLPKVNLIPLRHARIERILGIKITAGRVETMLKRLGMTVTKQAGGWRVRPPSYRFDILREVDLIEEVARVNGYHNLPVRRPAAGLSPHPFPEALIQESRMRLVMVDRDYQEVVTYSFIDPQLQSLVDPEASTVTLANPISADMATMRSSLWPGLIQALVYNRNRQQDRVRLFELGKTFARHGKTTVENSVIAGIAMGPALSKQWAAEARELDFFDTKGDLEALIDLTGSVDEFRFEAASHPALHSGQCAQIYRNKEKIGWIGALHPELLARLDIDKTAYVFQVELKSLKSGKMPRFDPISKYPAIRRDLAVIVDEQVTSQAIIDCIKEAAGELLVNLELFDEYRGEGIDSGRKSLALGLTLQDSSRTLKDKAVDAILDRVVGALSSELAAQLR
ncbi:MAG: phenylalanyl-tRNA synthetase [Gammaproteobacteria bacterium SG8_15]|nr:MAG: phenylalanyl-tRNA synthetase [Gammaproteobacteria bacterium SG8_15]